MIFLAILEPDNYVQERPLKNRAFNNHNCYSLLLKANLEEFKP